MKEKELQHIFIIGSKGIPGLYGGYETFVDRLTEYHQNNTNIKYHVACKGSEKKECEYHNARCFYIKVPNIGPAQAVYYDVVAFDSCCTYIKRKKIQHAIVYVLACRIGPFAAYLKKRLHKLGGILYVNPDGHEWMRKKWSAVVRRYWKISEQLMTKYADLLICDSKNIEKYIHDEYKKYSPRTTFIPYGAETVPSIVGDQDTKYSEWMKDKGLSAKEYYLMVGRFVPENNFEIIIKEFMKSGTKKSLAIITNINDKFLTELERKLHFSLDKRIKFAGTVYDSQMLRKIRENAYGYLHGHEVGGTNPSLLEALGATELNLLLDVSFNREVGEKAALYWKKETGDLAELIDAADLMESSERNMLGDRAKKRIESAYSWEYVCGRYEELWMRTEYDLKAEERI